jgi:amino acid transporter
VNYRGTSLSISLQKVVTFSFLAIACALIVGGFALGTASLQPAFESLTNRPWTMGALWIFATCAVFLNGFQIALYAIEERRIDSSVRQVILPMMLGLVAAIVFYVAIVISAARSAPWIEASTAELTAAFAFGKLTESGILSTVVLVAASISLLKSWNAYVIAGARLVLALGQQAMLPHGTARVHPRFGSPSVGIGVVLTINVTGVMLGRGAIVPIVNMGALVNAVIMVLCLIVLLRARQASTDEASFKVPGGTSFIWATTVAVAAMAIFALGEPLARSNGAIPVEWILMSIWAVIGTLVWKFRSLKSKP